MAYTLFEVIALKRGYFFGGFLFISALGTLLHFLYDWTGGNQVIAAFSGVNESTFEHLKLFYWPFLIFAIFECLKYGKNITGFWFIKLKSLLLSLTFIVAFFYTYRGIFGFNIDTLNILDFFIAAALSRIYEMVAKRKIYSKRLDIISFALIIIIGVLFVIFTFYPPRIALFADPKGFYGILP